MTDRPTAEQVAEARKRLDSDDSAMIPVHLMDDAMYILAELDAVTAERDAALNQRDFAIESENLRLRERDEARAVVEWAIKIMDAQYRGDDDVLAGVDALELPAVKAAMEVKPV